MKCTMLKLNKLNNMVTYETFRKICQIQFEIKALPFDDEGGYMALQDCLDEQIATCIDCGKCTASKVV